MARGIAALILVLAAASPVHAGDGVDGIASHYGPGSGVATRWCTWTLRHTAGCGWVSVQSHDSGLVVTAPVVDWCQCYRGTPDERLVDLQYDVLAALGLPEPFSAEDRGLYHVTVTRLGLDVARPLVLPDTAVPHA